MKNKNQIWDVDNLLFESKQTNCCSPQESNFFQNMRFKEEYEQTLSNDLIMSEKDNSLGIYIVRVNYDEYIVGCIHHPEKEIHVMNLSEALNVGLKVIGINDSDMTIGLWLRSINYIGIKYNQNYDNM